MFWRFGRFAESRPVAAVVCENVVWSRPSSPISSGNGDQVRREQLRELAPAPRRRARSGAARGSATARAGRSSSPSSPCGRPGRPSRSNSTSPSCFGRAERELGRRPARAPGRRAPRTARRPWRRSRPSAPCRSRCRRAPSQQSTGTSGSSMRRRTSSISRSTSRCSSDRAQGDARGGGADRVAIGLVRADREIERLLLEQIVDAVVGAARIEQVCGDRRVEGRLDAVRPRARRPRP